MPKGSKRNFVLSVATLFVLAMPAAAIAGGKAGGSKNVEERPTESLGLNYTKTQVEYKSQKSDGTVTNTSNSKMQNNKTGPNLFKSTAQGKHYSRVSH